MIHRIYSSFCFVSCLGLALMLVTACGNPEPQPTSFAAVPVNTNKPVLPEVQVIQVNNQAIAAEILLTGRLKATQKIKVVAEVQGRVLAPSKGFEVGTFFRAGEPMVQMEHTQFDWTLYGLRAKFLSQIMDLMADLEADFPQAYPNWQQYVITFDAQENLSPLPAFTEDRERYLFNRRNIPGQYYDIKAKEEEQSKYNIYAPFNGVLTDAQIDKGALVSPGAILGELQGTASYELEAAISEQDLAYFKMGNTVQLRNTSNDKTYRGKILRTGGYINQNTQTIPVYLAVSGKGLKEGMYLEGRVQGEVFDEVVALPSHLLTRNNEVYLAKDSMLVLHPVQRVASLQNQTLVRGIPEGSWLVNQPLSTNTKQGRIRLIKPGFEATTSVSLR